MSSAAAGRIFSFSHFPYFSCASGDLFGIGVWCSFSERCVKDRVSNDDNHNGTDVSPGEVRGVLNSAGVSPCHFRMVRRQ